MRDHLEVLSSGLEICSIDGHAQVFPGVYLVANINPSIPLFFL